MQNGATFVIIDKTLNPKNGASALLIQGIPCRSSKYEKLLWFDINVNFFPPYLRQMTVGEWTQKQCDAA